MRAAIKSLIICSALSLTIAVNAQTLNCDPDTNGEGGYILEQELHQGLTNRDLPEQYWVDIVTEQPEGYVVDENGDVHIYSAEALAWLSSVSNGLNGQQADDFEGRSIFLEDNIELSDALWLPISGKNDVSAVFKGDFHGKEHVVSGLTMSSGPSHFLNMGMFGDVSGASISNLILRNGYYEAHSEANCGGGFLANTVKDNSVIDRCFVECVMHTVEGMSPFVYLCDHSTISNCFVHSPLLTSELDNGIPGILVAISYPNSLIINCTSVIEKMSWTENCGLAGILNFGKIDNCYGYIGECIDFYGYGGGAAPRNGITRHNKESGVILNCYYNRLRSYDEPSYYIDMDDLPSSFNDGVIQDAMPFFEDGRGHWKLSEPVTFNSQTGTVSTNDLLDALNFKIEASGYETLLSWCDNEPGLETDLLPVFCNFDITLVGEPASVEHNVSLFPNPADDVFRIDGIVPDETLIYNALGQLVKSVNATNEVSVSDLPAGVYLLRITDNDGNTITSRLSISR